MADCPSAKAGVRLGDGEATRNALELSVRREGQDLKLTVR